MQWDSRLLRSGRATAIPTLVFDDVRSAVVYYRDVLGGQIQPVGDEALVRLHGAPLLLRQAVPGELADRATPCDDDTVTATVLVDRPYVLHRHIDDHGGSMLDGFEPGRDGIYKVVDYAGNVLAICPTEGIVPAAKRLLWPPVTDRVKVGLQRRRNVREEAPYRRQFAEFYQRLPDKQNIFYMFFTAGLLHWVAKSTSYVPDDVNLVLIGCDLPDYEQQWVRDTLGRPFFHLDLRVDDNIVWEFLFDTNEHDFGWLDIDCFVLNDELFAEMSHIADDDCVNGLWWHDSGFGFSLAATYFMFVNIAVVRALRAAGLPVSPNCYSYRPFRLPVPGRRCHSYPLTRRLCRQALQVLPPDELGRPRIPGPGMTLLDSTYLHQVIARTLGYGGHQVRRLAHRGSRPPGSQFEEISDEAVHIGGIAFAGALSEFSRLFHQPDTKLRYLLADHAALHDAADRLPAAYAERRRRVTEELDRFGMSPEAALQAIRQHLVADRGMSAEAARSLLRSPVRPRP